jgi:hypothetical protein
MKKLLVLAGLVLLVTAGSAFAQTGPGTGTNDPIYYNHSWTNFNNHDYDWGTNGLCLTNTTTPNVWSNKFNHSYAGQAAAGGGGQVRARFGKEEVPADAQTMIQQFQQDRLQLMTQLKTASDAERQKILEELEQLRTQLKERIQDMVQDEVGQAKGMQRGLANDRNRMMNQGAAGNNPDGAAGR